MRRRVQAHEKFDSGDGTVESLYLRLRSRRDFTTTKTFVTSISYVDVPHRVVSEDALVRAVDAWLP